MNDTNTTTTPPSAPAKRGRPPKGAAPVTDAQRQLEYRKRKREAAYAAWDDSHDPAKLAQHGTPAVLEAMHMAMEQAKLGASEADRALACMGVADLATELARRYTAQSRAA